MTKISTYTILNSFLFGGVIFLLSSCKTYYMSVDSFKRQVAGMNNSKMRAVTVQGPSGRRVTYKTYPIDFIEAINRKGNPVTIPNGPSIEIRFTDSANKKTVFYFDLIQFDGENITGSQSRIITDIKKTIPISTVKKIEVQNGKKNFRYIK